MKIYAVNFSRGLSLVKAKTPKAAENKAIRLFGQHDGSYQAKEATDSDLSYYKCMGGVVHE